MVCVLHKCPELQTNAPTDHQQVVNNVLESQRIAQPTLLRCSCLAWFVMKDTILTYLIARTILKVLYQPVIHWSQSPTLLLLTALVDIHCTRGEARGCQFTFWSTAEARPNESCFHCKCLYRCKLQTQIYMLGADFRPEDELLLRSAQQP